MEKSDQVIESHADLTPVKPPPLEGLPVEVADYIAYLETRTALLEAELEAKPYSGEARGLARTEVFGIARGGDGEVHNMKITLSQRSDIDSLSAFRALFNGLRAIKGDYNMTPFVQSLQTRQAAAPRAAAPQPSQPAQEPTDSGSSRPDEDYPS